MTFKLQRQKSLMQFEATIQDMLNLMIGQRHSRYIGAAVNETMMNHIKRNTIYLHGVVEDKSEGYSLIFTYSLTDCGRPSSAFSLEWSNSDFDSYAGFTPMPIKKAWEIIKDARRV